MYIDRDDELIDRSVHR